MVLEVAHRAEYSESRGCYLRNHNDKLLSMAYVSEIAANVLFDGRVRSKNRECIDLEFSPPYSIVNTISQYWIFLSGVTALRGV